MLGVDHCFFEKEGGEEGGLKSFYMQKLFSYAAPAANNFFWCVSVFL